MVTWEIFLEGLHNLEKFSISFVFNTFEALCANFATYKKNLNQKEQKWRSADQIKVETFAGANKKRIIWQEKMVMKA